MKRGTNGEIDCGPSRATLHTGEERGTSKQRAATGPMVGSTLLAAPKTRQTKCRRCAQVFTAVVGAGSQSCDACRAAGIKADEAQRAAHLAEAREQQVYREAVARWQARGPRL